MQRCGPKTFRGRVTPRKPWQPSTGRAATFVSEQPRFIRSTALLHGGFRDLLVLVHRGVGAVNEFLGVPPHVRENSCSDACRDLQRVFSDGKWGGEGGTHLLDAAGSLVGVPPIGKKNNELVPAVAAHGIRTADAADKTLRNGFEQGIADG